MQQNLICIQNLGSPDVEKLDMDLDSAHVHDFTCWFKSHSLVFLTTEKNEKICNRNNYVWVIENFPGQFYNLLLFWQVLYVMQNLKWRMDWCPMASYVRLSTLKTWDGNIRNVILVRRKFSTPSTPCLGPFPLTPLEIIKGGSQKFFSQFSFYYFFSYLMRTVILLLLTTPFSVFSPIYSRQLSYFSTTPFFLHLTSYNPKPG